MQKGNTPLHIATLAGKTEVVKLLLKEDADVNMLSKYNDVGGLFYFTFVFDVISISNQIMHSSLLVTGTQKSGRNRTRIYQKQFRFGRPTKIKVRKDCFNSKERVIVNTQFQQPPSKCYTRKSTGDTKVQSLSLTIYLLSASYKSN